jgi:hypothetical protein
MAIRNIFLPFGNLVVIRNIFFPFWYILSTKIWQPCFSRALRHKPSADIRENAFQKTLFPLIDFLWPEK